jgi:hypothetical protein
LPAFRWSLTTGWQAVNTRRAVAVTLEPPAALRYLAQARAPGVYVLLDFHPFLGDPLHVRLLKEIASDYDRVARTVVLMSHRTDIPPELDALAVRFELSLPTRRGWQRDLPRRGRRLGKAQPARRLRASAPPTTRCCAICAAWPSPTWRR